MISYKRKKKYESKEANLHEWLHNLNVRSPPSTTDYNGIVNSSIVFTFTDPKTYKGPVLQGWEPGVNLIISYFM